MRPRETLLDFKIKSTRGTRQVLTLALILGGILAFLGGFALVQIHFCHQDFPKLSAMACLRGFRN